MLCNADPNPGIVRHLPRRLIEFFEVNVGWTGGKRRFARRTGTRGRDCPIRVALSFKMATRIECQTLLFDFLRLSWTTSSKRARTMMHKRSERWMFYQHG